MNKNSKILESEEQEKELFAELIDKYFYCSFGCSTEGEMKVREKEWKLLIEIFYSFTKVIPEKIDELITFTLKQIGEFETIDRCCVIRVSKDGSAMRNTHIWRKAGISDDFFFCGPLQMTQLHGGWLRSAILTLLIYLVLPIFRRKHKKKKMLCRQAELNQFWSFQLYMRKNCWGI